MKKGIPHKKRLQRISKTINSIVEDIIERKDPLISHLYESSIIETEDFDIIITDPYEFDSLKDKTFNNKEIRLFRDIVLQKYPVFKNMPEVLSESIKEELNINISSKDLMRVRDFKKIVKKSEINYDNKKKQIKVNTKIRYRNK
ncbi:MAG: hypothetical protein ACOC3V_00570 [bacterium]